MDKGFDRAFVGDTVTGRQECRAIDSILEKYSEQLVQAITRRLDCTEELVIQRVIIRLDGLEQSFFRQARMPPPMKCSLPHLSQTPAAVGDFDIPINEFFPQAPDTGTVPVDETSATECFVTSKMVSIHSGVETDELCITSRMTNEIDVETVDFPSIQHYKGESGSQRQTPFDPELDHVPHTRRNRVLNTKASFAFTLPQDDALENGADPETFDDFEQRHKSAAFLAGELNTRCTDDVPTPHDRLEAFVSNAWFEFFLRV